MAAPGERPFRIAIVGGGIGGLFAALAINHFCKDYSLSIDVYEQAREYREIGAGVGLGINAAKLLHKLGLGDQLNRIGSRRSRNIWISFCRYDNSEKLYNVPMVEDATVTQASVHRAEFLDLLLDVVRERKAATLHTDKKCTGILETENGVLVKFRDGTDVAPDLVIGADGIHSAVRETYVKDNAVYSGVVAYRGLIDMDQVASWWTFECDSVVWCAKGRHLLVYPVSNYRLLNLVAFIGVPHEKLGALQESWTSEGTRDELLKDLEGFDDPAVRIVNLLPENLGKWKLNDRNPFDTWTFAQGRVVLLGDAAHALLPHQGAGAGQTIEDGYILARCLLDYFKTTAQSTDGSSCEGTSIRPSFEQFASLYQRVRLPRAQRVQVTSREAGDIYEMQLDGMKDLTFEDCLPIFTQKMENRMNWIWQDDLDQAYETERTAIY